MDPLDLTGAWFGRFAYPPGTGQEPVSFWAAIVETGGDFEGTTSEPNSIGDSSDLLGAILRGRREGRLVAFTKAYDGASDAAHAVAYAGDLDAEGETIVGEWRVEDMVGGFEMRRTHAPGAAEEAARDEAVEVRA
jgi:hypothetical protein